MCRSVCPSVCLSVCNHLLWTKYLPKLWTDFDEIVWRGRPRPRDQSIRFLWQFGSPLTYFAPIFQPHSNVLAFARRQHHNTRAVKQIFTWLPRAADTSLSLSRGLASFKLFMPLSKLITTDSRHGRTVEMSLWIITRHSLLHLVPWKLFLYSDETVNQPDTLKVDRKH